MVATRDRERSETSWRLGAWESTLPSNPWRLLHYPPPRRLHYLADPAPPRARTAQRATSWTAMHCTVRNRKALARLSFPGNYSTFDAIETHALNGLAHHPCIYG